MTKTISTTLDDHLSSEYQTLATCYKIKTTNGDVILAFTDHDADITFDIGDGDGSRIYKTLFGYDRTNIESKSEFNVDNVDIDIILDDAAISSSDLRSGIYDDAEIKIFLINYEDTSAGSGIVKLRRGTLGEIKMLDAEMGTTEIRGMFQRLTQNLLELYTPDCRADLGDTLCQVRLDPPFWAPSTAFTVRTTGDANTGSVVKPLNFNDRHFKCTTAGTSGTTEPSWNLTLGGTTADGGVTWTTIQALKIEVSVNVVTDRREFTITYTGDAPGDPTANGIGNLLNEGVVEWISGPNRGLKAEVKEWDLSGKRIKLFLKMQNDITSGDVITIAAGCNKSFAVCKTTFDNVRNFRGENLVPGVNLVLDFPDAPS